MLKPNQRKFFKRMAQLYKQLEKNKQAEVENKK